MDYEVAIIGCGPVGALAANFLGKSGVKTLVVEREIDPHPLPRAVHIDHEMKRLFQAAGLIDAVAGDMRETDGHLHLGADHGVIRYLGTVGQERPFGWANDYFFYQPELEAHLRTALAAYPNVTLALGADFESLTQDDEGVTLRFRGEDTADVRVGWAVGCDGARSAVRKQLGVALDDLGFEEPWLVVDCEVDGPIAFPDVHGVPEGADLQRLSVMLCDPARPATIVPGRGNHRRWEFMLLPGEDDAAMMAPTKVAELVGPYLADVPHRIIRAATYRFHGLIAERWQVGRVFLAGDAAHQTPPFFGQGMCHGFRDVANLAWKLELVLDGRAGPSLLDTYQPERDPHVRAVISSAVEAGRYICMLDPRDAAARDAGMRARARTAAPSTAADLIPPIRGGIVAAGTSGAGERFIQPLVRDCGGTRLLDDCTGGGWRLFVRRREVHAANDALKHAPELNITLIDVDALGDALSRWLDRHGVDAVLVRPDFYVFGTATTDVGALIAEIAGRLGLKAPISAEAEPCH
ncbi:bifunctional 3-(3-hydroxy-phenyl)propionate/3-hydroxycinnamic acid hydroxylase [Sphingosinicella sp. BN140058]|uniref:bifunctional 3-(3-hydroxy-phenyl)propionate/3-hydroxycinnamic acid hydroxylase MhpA n=1 Tax=Sphingosinicella sp. BN140058 TaxID=1892855 RepID=UPI001011EE6C|nr:bifunctional 3-(3-hydroxy-phenyl)propionate/3-hydroxycinnamic acid hydroxylase [Sphingosinicella sp. BN140058]QAY78107.1 bifunctional 3-(3-hydroxy-phenyl)propionate/3-hydroxycinnamic acid hydroxylase [Sphingosinicella sp. BN140058]